jgi:Leucine-rich repeat (LRR) protein
MRFALTWSLLCLLVAGPSLAAIPTSQHDALLAFFAASGGPSWTDHTNWGVAANECTWVGVECDASQSNVTTLSLPSNNLDGTLAPQLGDLPALQNLFLYSNSLHGTVPSELTKLTNLKAIILSNNHLEGELPDNIGDLQQLESIEIYSNRLTGQIPASIGNLSQLVDLVLTDNHLSGPIPLQLGGLKSLERLDLGTNQLTDKIPGALGDLSALQYLLLSENYLSGSIPSELSRLSALKELALGSNQLTGPVPPALGDLAQLERLDLQGGIEGNRLQGPIPAQLGNLQHLTTLWLSGNRLEGSIPPLLGSARALQDLQLSANLLDGEIPAELMVLPELMNLDLSANRLSGPLPDLGNLSNLRSLDLSNNLLTGPIPADLGNLILLESLILSYNPLGAALPARLSNLTNLVYLYATDDQLTGPLPDLSSMTKLQEVFLYSNELSGDVPPLAGASGLTLFNASNNQFSGRLPREWTSLTNLLGIDVYANQLSGDIPEEIGNLTKLESFNVSENHLTGRLPAGISDLTKLTNLQFQENDLSGPLPSFSRLVSLETLDGDGNELEGELPRDLAPLTRLTALGLAANRFSGTIPSELGQLASLQILMLERNNLRGPLPGELLNLTSLANGQSDFSYNGLFTTNTALRDFLNAKEDGGDWQGTQNIAPTVVAASEVTDRSAIISWTPIAFSFYEGGYQLDASLSRDGPPVISVTTSNKYLDSAVLRGLNPSTGYFVTIRTITYPHESQQNLLVSDPTAAVVVTTTARVLSPPLVAVAAYPSGLVEVSGAPANEDLFVLTNYGDVSTSISFSISGTPFVLTPAAFVLPAGGSQDVTIAAPSEPPGEYDGYATPIGEGVPEDLQIRMTLLSVSPPEGIPIADPVIARVTFTGEANSTSAGAVAFRNQGTAPLTGVLVSDAPWVIAPSSVISIPAGDQTSIGITIDRTRRPDALAPAGALTSHLRLLYVQGPASKALLERSEGSPPSGSTAVSIVTVVDMTVAPLNASSPPPLAAGEIARFIAGIVNLVGSQERLATDVSLSNSFGTSSINDLRIYLGGTATASSSLATFASLPPSRALSLPNPLSALYKSSLTQGTAQIRSASWQKLQATARLVADRGAGGILAGTLPVFRSDRAAGAGESISITGIRSDETTGARLFLQEAAGQSVSSTIRFLSPAGATLAQRDSGLIAAFGFVELADAVPPGTATAIVTSAPGSAGRLVAYVTMSDTRSGDRWSVTDWPLFFGYSPASASTIPLVATSGPGRRRAIVRGGGSSKAEAANNSARTGTALSLFNGASSAEVATLRYHDVSGTISERSLTLAAGETRIYIDVLRELFFRNGTFYGYVEIAPPRGGSIVAAARKETVSPDGSIGDAVPALAASDGLRLGQSESFFGLEDALPAAVAARLPGAYRVDLGLIESAGAAVKVRVTLSFYDGRALLAVSIPTRTFDLGPKQILRISDIATAILGEATRSSLGDLHDVQVRIEVIQGEGAVTPFIESIEASSGDSVFRVE